MNSTISQLRSHYKPQKVSLLLIAESPPESDDEEVRFFYNPHQERWDHMYRAVMEAIFTDFQHRPGEKDHWLRKFKERGCYMIDATDSPINRKSSAERRRVLNAAVDKKLAEIETLVTLRTPIVLVKKNVFEAFSSPLRRAGYNVIHNAFLPFPSHGHQDEFVKRCRRCLNRHLWFT